MERSCFWVPLSVLTASLLGARAHFGMSEQHAFSLNDHLLLGTQVTLACVSYKGTITPCYLCSWSHLTGRSGRRQSHLNEESRLKACEQGQSERLSGHTSPIAYEHTKLGTLKPQTCMYCLCTDV